MLYNFKDRALMGMKKNNIFAKERKRNTILTVFWRGKLARMSTGYWTPFIPHSQILLTFQDGGRVKFPTLAWPIWGLLLMSKSRPMRALRSMISLGCRIAILDRPSRSTIQDCQTGVMRRKWSERRAWIALEGINFCPRSSPRARLAACARLAFSSVRQT